MISAELFGGPWDGRTLRLHQAWPQIHVPLPVMLIWSADVEMTSTVDTALYRRGVAGDVVPYFYVAPERAPEAIE